MSELEFKNIGALNDPQDVSALIQEVLREAYQQTTEDLRHYAEKVRHLNEKKKAIRSYLSALRDFDMNMLSAAQARGVNLCSANEKDVAVLREIFAESAKPYEVGLIEYELCIPNRVPAVEVNSFAHLKSEIVRWEEKLNTVGDDAQLANVDLQNILQKQQQTLQMMSNISKMTHDNAMAIIRKIGG